MAKVVLDGPPWCGFVDPEEAYFRGQVASVGSGALGGWGYASSGGFFRGPGWREREVKQEVTRTRAQPPETQLLAEATWRARPAASRRHGDGRVQPLRPHAR